MITKYIHIIFNYLLGSPILIPYPNLEANNISSPDGLVSIFRLRIDECDRMWGFDTGVNDILGDNKAVQPMKLIVIDLKTNTVTFIKNYECLQSILILETYVPRCLDFVSQVILFFYSSLYVLQFIRKYTLKDTDVRPETFIADLVVDVAPGQCDKAYAYMSDLNEYGMVVYSWEKNDSWRINHNFFHFDPLNGNVK